MSFTSSLLYRRIHDLFDHPAVFDAYQRLVDGGKGRRIRRFLQDVPYQSVLDLGCGTGNWAVTAKEGAYLGVDIAPEFIEAARRRYARDSSKRFMLLDPTKEPVSGSFDLAQLISVLHHLSDTQIEALLKFVVPSVRYLFVLDLYPMPWHPVASFLYAADRGDFVRSPLEQTKLLLSDERLRLLRQDDYFAPGGLYRHTLLLFERRT